MVGSRLGKLGLGSVGNVWWLCGTFVSERECCIGPTDVFLDLSPMFGVDSDQEVGDAIHDRQTC